MSRKTVYYHDPLHDDFAPTNGRIRPKPIGADFPYEHPSPVWQALAFVVYRLVMTPFLFLYCKLVFGLRIREHRTVQIVFNDVKVLYRFKEAGMKFFCG